MLNILVCTPGRLLQHMDETPGFDPTNLQVLVLDEADRTLDMGFSKTMDAILANLPAQRQTMLFSATQTKSIKVRRCLLPGNVLWYTTQLVLVWLVVLHPCMCDS